MNFEKKDTEDLSTEELIRRLMENFKQEDEAEKQKEEAAVSLDFHFNDIDTPAEEAGDDTAEEPSLEEEIENDKENEGELLNKIDSLNATVISKLHIIY